MQECSSFTRQKAGAEEIQQGEEIKGIGEMGE
jgi:hypothetical protein